MTDDCTAIERTSSDPAFARLADYVIAHTGLAYYRERQQELRAHLCDRLGRLGAAGADDYLRRLMDGPRGDAELDVLIEQLTIGETYFFRHTQMFEALRRRVLPDLIQKNRSSRRLRVWSAGCAIGAEAYSLAILIHRELAHLHEPAMGGDAGWSVEILGTDVNRRFLTRAREGLFEEWALRGVTPPMRGACFTPEGDRWRIAPRYRQGVSFQYHNLVKHPCPSLADGGAGFDLILCRNVMIYFSGEIADRVVDGFYGSLADGGWLAVGHAELSTERFGRFRAVSEADAVLYQRPAAADLACEHVSNGHAQGLAIPGPAAPAQCMTADAGNGTGRHGHASPRVCPCESPMTFGTGKLADSRARGTRVARHAPAPAPEAPSARHADADAAALAVIQALADRGELDRAIGQCRGLLDHNPLDAMAHFYHGLLLGQAGADAPCEQALRRAVYLDRGFVFAHYHLGLRQLKSGRLGEAGRSFRVVLDLLSPLAGDAAVDGGQELTASELRETVGVHLRTLEEEE